MDRSLGVSLRYRAALDFDRRDRVALIRQIPETEVQKPTKANQESGLMTFGFDVGQQEEKPRTEIVRETFEKVRASKPVGGWWAVSDGSGRQTWFSCLHHSAPFYGQKT